MPVLGTKLTDRVNDLVVDSLQDPLDRFNYHTTHTSIKDLKDDYHEEYYLINSEGNLQEWDQDGHFLTARKFD